jgi:hypothetical protein
VPDEVNKQAANTQEDRSQGAGAAESRILNPESAFSRAAGNTSRQALAPFHLVVGLASALPVAALAALAIFIGIWWVEHDAHLRSEGALREIQKQTNAEVSGLQAKADAAVRDANQSNARAVSELEASRRVLEQQSQDLRQRLATLEGAERTRVAQVAALSAPEVWKRLGEQLGPGSIASSVAGVGSGEVGSRLSVVSQNPNTDPDHRPPTIDFRSLTEAGARKVETAFVELDSCHQESAVQSQQLTACQKEGAAEAAMVATQKASIAELNQALADKDQILAKRQTEFNAELKVARGTFLGRVGRIAEYVAVGFVIGKVLR